MKPWEMNWDNTNETKTEDIKPWEKKWDTDNSTDFNVKNYNGTSLIGEAGEDAKPYSKMDLFLKNLFTFDVKTGAEAEERQANNPRIQALEKVRADGFDDVKWGEVGKSLVRGSLELGKSATASPLKIYGDWSMDERDTSLMTPQELKDVKYNNFKAQAYIKTGEYIEKLWDMGLKAEWLKEDEETFRGSFVENPSMTRVLSLGASAIPSIGFFGGAAKITGSRKAASILLAGADNDDLYFEAREAGESQNKALGLYATGTAGTAILEKYGFDQIFNQRVTAPLSKRIMSATLSEGFTEGFQTAYQNAVKKYGYDDTQDLFEGVVESVIAGALSGGAISTADAGYVKLQNARGKLKDKGATDEALDMMQEELARELSYHRDTIEPMFQSKITESLNNLEKFVKDNEGTAEAQKALKTKAELEEVYNLVNKSLTDNGVNAEVANADAKVWQGIALWGSQETGLSPMEYINQRMPKVQKKRLADFLNERERRIATGNESELEILRQDINRLKKGVSRKASKGLRLSQFIKQQGGINDDRGDIKSMGASVGLLNKNGISLDEATFKAWEAGYIQSTERPEINQLLDLLSDDLGNHPVYSFEDKTTEDNRQYYLALEQALYEAGADINKDSLEVINQKLKAYEQSLAQETTPQYNPELDDFIPFQSSITLSNPNLSQDIEELVSELEKDKNVSDWREIGKVSNTLSNLARQNINMDLAEYNHNIDTSSINHIFKNHGDVAKEERRGQIAVTKDDLKNIPNIVYNWDFIAFGGKNKHNQDVIIYGKNMPDGSSVYIEEIRTGRKTLTTNTLIKYKTGVNSNSFAARIGNNVRNNTSHIKIISKKDENVNRTFYQESLNIAQENAELDKVNPAYEGETINVNGVERTVYNSNGDRIAMSEPALRNFYNWFGDSKVVNKEGRPLVMYHGTNKKFEEFDKSFIGKKHKNLYQGKGFYFTKEYYKAQNYGRKIMPVYLKIENPALSDYDLKPENDGIYAGQGVYVAFNPNQIKSTSNRGTYSESDNIYYQTAYHGGKELEGGKFSLKYAGKQTGLEHGYGVYLAMDRETATRYRSTIDADFTYNGKKLSSYYEELIRKNEFDKAQVLEDFLLKLDTSLMEEDLYEPIAWKWFKNDIEPNIKSEGKLYEVDIPENPYLLDEQKTFEHQSNYIKNAIKKLNNEAINDILDEDTTGEDIYGELVNYFSKTIEAGDLRESINKAQKKASEALESVGIKGITYYSRADGQDFVIFNPDDVKVIQKFYQDVGRPKGAFAQNLDQKGVIYLFEDADASTFMHETAHFFRKELEEFGTARSKEMLQKMVEWENSEFDKRYNVQQTANGFVVTDKLGNVVYGDKKPFQSVQSAREYGRNEIFARGFEQYLRDGKAPSNYLKQAFRSFWSWLRSLYKSAKALNVDINDNIRSVYNEIIGGADLDFYLSAPVDEVLQQRVAESKDREEYLDDVIKRAQAKPHKGVSGWIKEKTESDKGLVKWWNAAIVPISTRAKRVNIKLRNRLRAYDYAVNNKYNEYMAQVKPFLDKWEKFSEQDAIAFDLALKNSYMKKQIDIVNKYNAYNEFVQVKNLLNSLFDQAIDVGVELGYTADYFPRQVEDVDGFMAYLHGSAMASQMRRALKDADPTNTFTTEEKAEFINKYLRGFNRRDLNKPLPGNVKDRIIDVITPEMNKYYKPSMQALISYIDGMNQSIESRRFWGFEYESIDDSIGSMVSYLVDIGLIQPEQDAEVQEILKARFKAKGVTNPYLKKQKNLSYIYLMGGINSAITQIEDISVAIYKAGFWNTATSVFSKNRKGLSREELGLERIGQEFAESSTSSKAVSAVFKMTGLDKIDAFGKNTLINATFNKFQEMANKNEDALRARLEPILEQETNQTIQDIKKGEISENVKLLMFNELADMQPISLSEMPEYYLTSGNGRVFYMLKTFALKRIDIFRNECFDKIKQGNVKEGIQNLFRLSILMILCGMSKDAIINMLYGRDMDLSESFINNLLGLTGFLSKYSLYQLRDEGVGGFVSSVAIPPVFSIWSDLGRDIYKSLFTKKGKDISDYEAWKGLPLIGRFYYWWLGGGRTKLEKKKNKLK